MFVGDWVEWPGNLSELLNYFDRNFKAEGALRMKPRISHTCQAKALPLTRVTVSLVEHWCFALEFDHKNSQRLLKRCWFYNRLNGTHSTPSVILAGGCAGSSYKQSMVWEWILWVQGMLSQWLLEETPHVSQSSSEVHWAEDFIRWLGFPVTLLLK